MRLPQRGRVIMAAFQLKHAVLVDPLDVDSIALGLRRALDMPHHERRWRWRNMLHSVKGQDILTGDLGDGGRIT